MEKINESKICNMAEIIADTKDGLTTSQILRICNQLSEYYDIQIPYTTIDSSKGVSKKNILIKNLLRFDDSMLDDIFEFIFNDKALEKNELIDFLRYKFSKKKIALAQITVNR